MALMARYSLMNMAKRLKLITLTVLGGIIGMVPDWRTEFQPAAGMPVLPTAFVWMMATLALVVVLRQGGSPIKLMLGLAALCFALTYTGVIG